MCYKSIAIFIFLNKKIKNLGFYEVSQVMQNAQYKKIKDAVNFYFNIINYYMYTTFHFVKNSHMLQVKVCT